MTPRIFPEEIPARVRQASGRAAEVKTYHALRDQLDDEFTVMYSVAWLGRSDDGTSRDGEADFVLLHPRHGILVLEVKGGAISRTANEWSSTDRRGNRHRIKDPLAQARKSAYAILRKL